MYTMYYIYTYKYNYSILFKFKKQIIKTKDEYTSEKSFKYIDSPVIKIEKLSDDE